VIVFEDSSAATTSAVTRACCLPLAELERSDADDEVSLLEDPVIEPLEEPEGFDEPLEEPPEYVPEPLLEPVEPELEEPVSSAARASPAASINAVRVVSVFMVVSRLWVKRSSSMSFMIENDWRVGDRPQE